HRRRVRRSAARPRDDSRGGGRARRPDVLTSMLRLSWAVATHPGLRRESNEDAYAARPDLGLFVVADGMGGHAAGEVASKVAADTIEAFAHETRARDLNSTWPFPPESSLSIDGNRLK